MSFKQKELNPEEEGKKCGAKLAKSVCKLLNKPRFKVGDMVYYRHWTGELRPIRIIKSYRRLKSYKVDLGICVFNETELYATEEEARNAK